MSHRIITSDTVEIGTPSQWVWDILTDFECYPEWNPFTTTAKGRLALGNSLDLYVVMPSRGDRTQTEIISTIAPPNQLAWGMTLGFKKLLSARREQILTTIDSQRCSYTTNDAFNGLLAALVYRLFYDDIKSGFNNVAYALRDRAETLWAQRSMN